MKHGTTTRGLALLVGRNLALSVGLVVAATSCSQDLRTGALTGAVRTPPLVVGSISLPDASRGDASVAMKAPLDELYLVYFGYTSCPDVCPTTMNDIRVALDGLPKVKASRVTVAMVTVDPDRDTPQVLAQYLAHFFDHSIALRTSDAEQLGTAAKAFGVQFEVGEHADGAAYNVAHTAVTYVVDDTGTVAVEWPFGLDSKDMTSDLLTLLNKEQP